MKKPITTEILISLARKAKHIEPIPEGMESLIIRRKMLQTDNRVGNFIETLGLKIGKNTVDVDALEEAFYVLYPEGIDNKLFIKNIRKHFKVMPNETIKMNMKAITIIEKAKEIKQHEETNEKEPSSSS